MILKKFMLLIISALITPLYSSMTPHFSQIKGAYYRGGVDNIIIKDIDKASKSIKMAMYYLTNKNITKALVEAHNRGVEVKIITDDKKRGSKRYRYLASEGIDIEDDRDKKALMHNKILIVDSRVVWVGSGNYTVYSFYRNHDNYLRVSNRDIAHYYTKKFDRLYTHNSLPIEPYIRDNIEIHFSPDSDIQKRLLELIDSAKDSINIMMFAFTNRDISRALLDAQKRGVDIKIVVDKRQNSYQKYSVYRELKANGIDIKLDKNRYKLHHKVIIIDRKITILGSYNFTKWANSNNDENIIIIKNSAISSSYLEEFSRVY
jgi:phosphatidylserine/phosphatidylglycerophosphate/cardiolipin synthase-like enzyme